MFALFFLRLFLAQIDQLFLQDKRLSPSYGYSPVGTRATVKRQAQNWGPRITAIPVICMEGIVEVGIYQGNVDGARFEEFVDQKLLQVTDEQIRNYIRHAEYLW